MITVRALAYQILLQLQNSPAHPDRLLRTVMQRHALLQNRDRALLTELVYGVLRWQKRLDWHIDQLSRARPNKIHPQIRLLLRLGLYQILFLDKVPDHAAVHETVEIVKQNQPRHLVGFVNGLLRTAVRRGNDWPWPSRTEDPAGFLAITHSHPRWVAQRFINTLGHAEAERLCKANNQVAPLSIRVNGLEANTNETISVLESLGMKSEASPYLDQAVRLFAPRRDIAGIEPYRRGWIQIQDEASQLVSLILAPEPGERILDLCAGFGGKASHCAILMKNRGEIVAIDEAGWKTEELKKNAARQGLKIIATKAADLFTVNPDETGDFDRVLLDAPCTGFGVLRRNPDIKWRRNTKDPYRFSQTQLKMLRHASKFVRKGGILLYSTCTLFDDENEKVAEAFQQEFGWKVEVIDERLPGRCRDMAAGPYLRSWPHRHHVDGFFAACWRKPA